MAPPAVNRPTDTKLKERDVNNKLQLYGIYSAFATGKLPSNKQVDVALNSALASQPLSSPSKKLSEDGQLMVAGIRDVIEQAKLLVLTKNKGNLLQDFVWQTQQLSTAEGASSSTPVDKETARQHGNEALSGLRTLGTLILSNGQFRKLLDDAAILLRDIAGDAATNTAGRVKPTGDQLAQIDHAAEDNTWHDVPDMSKARLQGQIKSTFPFGKKDAETAAGDVTQAAHPEGARDPADAADLAAQRKQDGATTGLNAKAAVGEAKAHAEQNVPEEEKTRLRKQRERTQKYLGGKMPRERREQTVWRLKKMVVEIQGHQDYLQAVETLLRLAEHYTGHSKTLALQGKGAVKGAHEDDALQMAEADLKTLIERFANNTSTDDLLESINTIYRDAEQDQDLRQWFKNVDTYIRKCLKQQGFIMEDASTSEWNELYDRGHVLLRQRYRGHTDRVADEFKFLAKQFELDAQNKAFAASVTKLFGDLGSDETGNMIVKPHLLKDLTEVILPGFFENIRYVPIPRIEYSDPQIDAVVENLVVEGDNLAPNVLEFGSDNYWRWGRKNIQNKNKSKVMLSVSGVQMDLRDVSYYIKRKAGFPAITDQGVMDIFMGGSGFSFKVQMETADQDDKIHYFKIDKVTTDVKNLSIKLKSSNHKLLFGLFKPLLLRVMRPVLQRVLEKQIKDSVNQLDSLLYSIRQEADQAAQDAMRNPDPENVQNIYQRYASAANKKMMQGKQKKEEAQAKAKDTKVNVAVTQKDSIFKDVSLPGGISTKATEFKDLAAKGDKWESPVFSIGSAKESTALPKAPAVTRKPHAASSQGKASQGGAAAGFGSQVDESFQSTANGNGAFAGK